MPLTDETRNPNTIPTGVGISIVMWLLFLGAYLLLMSTHSGVVFVNHAAESIRSSTSVLSATVIYGMALIVCLMTPLTPTTVLVLLGVALFGPVRTFILSTACAIVAVTAAYWVGRALARVPPGSRMQKAIAFLQVQARRPRIVWSILFLARAIPNPLYDVWAYAAGVSRIPYPLFISASVAGGIIPLGVICYLGSVHR